MVEAIWVTQPVTLLLHTVFFQARLMVGSRFQLWIRSSTHYLLSPFCGTLLLLLKSLLIVLNRLLCLRRPILGKEDGLSWYDLLYTLTNRRLSVKILMQSCLLNWQVLDIFNLFIA